MKKRILKLFATCLVLCLTMTSFGSFSAAAAPQGGIMPLYNNAASVATTVHIDSNGKLTISYKYSGYPSITTKAVIKTHIDKKTLGLF